MRASDCSCDVKSAVLEQPMTMMSHPLFLLMSKDRWAVVIRYNLLIVTTRCSRCGPAVDCSCGVFQSFFGFSCQWIGGSAHDEMRCQRTQWWIQRTNAQHHTATHCTALPCLTQDPSRYFSLFAATPVSLGWVGFARQGWPSKTSPTWTFGYGCSCSAVIVVVVVVVWARRQTMRLPMDWDNCFMVATAATFGDAGAANGAILIRYLLVLQLQRRLHLRLSVRC